MKWRVYDHFVISLIREDNIVYNQINRSKLSKLITASWKLCRHLNKSIDKLYQTAYIFLVGIPL